MSRKLIQKVIDAITENKLDYARGILDTILEGLPEEKGLNGLSTPIPNIGQVAPVTSNKELPKDEGTMLDSIAKANLAKVMNGLTQE